MTIGRHLLRRGISCGERLFKKRFGRFYIPRLAQPHVDKLALFVDSVH